MEYVIPALIVILLIAGFVTFLVVNATEKGGPNAEGEGSPPGIGADDETPLGDTTQHAGEQTPEGTTARGQDDGRFSGRGRPHETPSDPDDAAHVARPGEAEGAERLEFEGRQPRR
jgi:hypothetical protein